MKTVALSSMSFIGLVLFVAGCGSPAVEHNLTPPPAKKAFTVPTTKEQKIEAIKKAAIPKEQKEAAIARVNAGQ